MATSIEASYYVLNSGTSKPARQSARTSLDGVLRRYGLALAFVVAALVLTLPLQQLFPHPFLFLFFAGGGGQRVVRGHGSGTFCGARLHACGGLLFRSAALFVCRQGDGGQLFRGFCDLLARGQLGERLQKEERGKSQGDAQATPGSGRRTYGCAAAIDQRAAGKRAAHSDSDGSHSPAGSRSGTLRPQRHCRAARTGACGSRGFHDFRAEMRLLLRLRAREG